MRWKSAVRKEKMKRIMKEAVKSKRSRRNELGLVAFLPGTIKSLGVFNT